jgi:hypothetical protein
MKTNLKILQTNGLAEFEPDDRCRVTVWMDKGDACLGRWYQHFVEKDLVVAIVEAGDGRRAVFRRDGVRDLEEAAAERAARVLRTRKVS